MKDFLEKNNKHIYTICGLILLGVVAYKINSDIQAQDAKYSVDEFFDVAGNYTLPILIGTGLLAVGVFLHRN